MLAPSARVLRDPRFLCLLSGLLLALCFPSADLGLLAFLALVPMLLSIREAQPGRAFARGLGAGFVFFALLYHWIATFAGGKVGWFGSVAGYVLALLMAVFVGAFAVGASSLFRSRSIPEPLKLLAIPSLWVLCEYARQLGSVGMAWGDIGYTQWRDPLALGIAPFAGIWGISWVVALVNTAFCLRARATALVAAGAILALLAGGHVAKQGVVPSGAQFVAAALQADIDQDVPWSHGRPTDPAYFAATLAAFDDLARQAHRSGAQLCLLAETATPGYLRFDRGLRAQMQAISDRNHVALLAGGRDIDPVTSKELNIAALISPGAPAVGAAPEYAKQQLVPFGEFVPFQQQLQWLSVLHVADFDDEPGRADQNALDGPALVGKVGVAICYESSYPRFLVQQTRSGANLLTVITDDTWFGHTAAAKQHLAMSAVRAAECDRWLVRCGATGISAVFSPDGREVGELGLFRKGIVLARVQPLQGDTLFVRWGDWFVWFSLAVIAASCLWEARGRGSARTTRGERAAEPLGSTERRPTAVR